MLRGWVIKGVRRGCRVSSIESEAEILESWALLGGIWGVSVGISVLKGFLHKDEAVELIMFGKD